jgi:AcrR family transcriptional regulator
MARGHFRIFDTEEALDRAMEIFWQRGYEGASLSELTKAMGISRPSLYAAYGNKEELFYKVLDRYAEGPAAFCSDALLERTAYEVVKRLLNDTIDNVTNPSTPLGCLSVQAALSTGEEVEPIRQEVNSRRASIEIALCRRLEQAKLDGDLPADSDPAILARYITTFNQGMSVQASAGTSREALHQIAEMALRAWPT